jgi:hypothetical protein
MEKPQFTHDCKACTFLGRFNGHDLYFCTQRNFPTVIARYSSAGPDYKSGIAFAGVDPEIGEAHKRAVKRGFLSDR